MTPKTFYHIYNRGNNRQPIFIRNENYYFFCNKFIKHVTPHADIVAYCLMPNHFHLMVYAKNNIDSYKFSNDLRVMLRSYTRAINKQENWSGSLFQQHTKIKPLEEKSKSDTMTLSRSIANPNPANDSIYPLTCFHYIHQNPMKANLVNRMEDWEMSSFKEYAGLTNETICSKHIAYELLEIPSTGEQFIENAYDVQIIDKA